MQRPSHTRFVRFIAVLLASLLLGSTSADAAGLDPCAHHGVASVFGHAAPAEKAAVPVNGHGGHHSAASKDAAAQHDSSHTACTCLGACASAQAIVVPHATLAAARTTLHISTAAAPPVIAARTSLQLDLLPYGIAPPSHTLV